MPDLIDVAPMSEANVDAMFTPPAGTPAIETPAAEQPLQLSAPAQEAATDPTVEQPAEIKQAELDIKEALKALGGDDVPTEEQPTQAEKPEDQTARTQPVVVGAEEFPDDVKVETDASGKQWVKVSQARWNHIYNHNYKPFKEIQTQVGERITPQRIQELQQDGRILDRMRLDLLSGDPTQQRDLFAYHFQQADNALRSGDAVNDPMPAAIETFLGLAREARPQVFEKIRTQERRSTIDELYSVARRTGNNDLLVAAQNVDFHLFGSFKKAEQIPLETDVDLRMKELTERETRLQRQESERSERDWEGFTASTRQGINTTVAGVLDGMLGKIPTLDGERKANVRARLDAELRNAFATEDWRRGNTQLFQEASLAAPHRRNEFAQKLVNRYKAKAQMVLRDSLPRAVNAETHALKSQADSTMARVQGQQGKTPMVSGGIPVQPQVPILNGGKGAVSSADWEAHLNQVFQ